MEANLGWVFPAMVVAALVALQAAVPGSAQIAVSPCTASMLTSFTPCMNFLTNSSANMTTPTPGCCNSLMSLASNSSGCLCQILTGGSPFPLPVNRTSAISLPKSCNMSGVPIQCNLATSPPASAPGLSPIAPFPGFFYRPNIFTDIASSGSSVSNHTNSSVTDVPLNHHRSSSNSHRRQCRENLQPNHVSRQAYVTRSLAVSSASAISSCDDKIVLEWFPLNDSLG
ncbi:hypothetical protein V2J09_018002 [Rumex salicifolius]